MNRCELGQRWKIDIGQLSILDQGTAERFIAVLMNEVLDSSASAPLLQSDVRDDNWSDLGDLEGLNYDLLKDRAIGEDLIINLYKVGIDCLNIEVKNKHFIEATSNHPSATQD
jgi:hypothetical protein